MRIIDAVHYPRHYFIVDDEGVKICEVRDVQAHVCDTLEGLEAADMANAIKYLLRSPFKHDFLQDLYKAKFFIDAMIERREKEYAKC